MIDIEETKETSNLPWWGYSGLCCQFPARHPLPMVSSTQCLENCCRILWASSTQRLRDPKMRQDSAPLPHAPLFPPSPPAPLPILLNPSPGGLISHTALPQCHCFIQFSTHCPLHQNQSKKSHKWRRLKLAVKKSKPHLYLERTETA